MTFFPDFYNHKVTIRPSEKVNVGQEAKFWPTINKIQTNF